MKSRSIALNAVFVVGAMFALPSFAAEPAVPSATPPSAPIAAPPSAARPAPPPAARPAADKPGRVAPIEKTGAGVFRMGDVQVDKLERSITFPAEVNMDSGMLEYLLVHRRGKVHESLLRTLVEPYSLQVAFLLLGFEGTDKRLRGQGDPATPTGERVRITLSYEIGSEKTRIPVESWLANRFRDGVKDVEPLDWVYTGSFVSQGRFMSQESGSIVAIWHDPVALIDNASPGGASNAIWVVKKGAVPAVGTPVEVIITPVK